MVKIETNGEVKSFLQVCSTEGGRSQSFSSRILLGRGSKTREQKTHLLANSNLAEHLETVRTLQTLNGHTCQFVFLLEQCTHQNETRSAWERRLL